MADDLLKDLLTSPLEDEAAARRRRRRGHKDQGREQTGITPDRAGEAAPRARLGTIPLLWGLGAAIVGALIVIVGYAVAAEDPPPSTTTTTPTSTTLAQGRDDGSPAGLPEGYVAVGDRLGMRVQRILVRADGVFFTVVTVAQNSFEPSATTGFQGGLWSLVMSDGRRITSTVESFDPLARGTVSIWFPPDGILPEDIAALELNGTATRLTNSFSTESVDGFVLADRESELTLTPTRFDIDAGVTLVIDQLTLSTTTGTMSWSLDGEAVANATVVPTLTVSDGGGTTFSVPTAIQTSSFALFHPSIAAPALTEEGATGFRMPDTEALPADEELTARVELQVTWATYDPVVVTLPVGDAAVAEVG